MRASLVITGTKRGSSSESHHHELSVELLIDRTWPCKLYCFHKIAKGFSPFYLQQIPGSLDVQYYQTRAKSPKSIERLWGRTKTFEYFYFRYCIKE